MLLILLKRPIVRISKCYSSWTATHEEYTAVPIYPPILDTSYGKEKQRRKQTQYDEIKSVKTVEEKQIKLNMPKYYGFKCYQFKECLIPYNNLQLAQHITRTHMKLDNSLPEYYNNINVDAIQENIKSKLEDALAFELEGYKTHLQNKNFSRQELENQCSTMLVQQINRIIMNNMVQEHPHLLDVQVDVNPRLEAFWFAGGMNPPKNIKQYRTGQEWRKHTENDPIDRAIRYKGEPILSVRSNLPLKPLLNSQDVTKQIFDVPKWIFDPKCVGIPTAHKHVANIPGYWPGDYHPFGFISYHKRGHIINRPYNDAQDNHEALHQQAILSSFSWLHAQANFLGFTTFNDITYPLVTQTIITNGQIWSLYSYQMNTMLIHGENVDENPLVNICYGTSELKLFEEFKNGKLIGFNDDVLKLIVKYYANTPEERMGVNLKPYLGQGEKVIADYDDIDKRNWLEREYKYLVSNRPRFKDYYELYHWEKIYKVDHPTRPMDPRRRPFEVFYKPSDRKLNDRQAFYIPKALRPDLPKNKGRYAKEYFP